MEELIKRLERVIQTGAPDKDGMHPITAEVVLEVVKELSEHSTNLASLGTDLISRQGAIVAVKDALLAWSYMPTWRDDKIVDAVIGVESATDNNVGAKLSTLKIERAISGLTEWQKHVQTDSDIDRDISVAVKVLKAQLSTNLASLGTDLISRTWLLAEYDKRHKGPPGGARKLIEEAPSALSTNLAEVGTDCISREQAIDTIEDFPHGDVWNVESMEEMVDRIKQLPPIQPEIVRCKDCKYAEYIDDVKTLWCTECGQGRTVAPNDFCSYAERREVTT